MSERNRKTPYAHLRVRAAAHKDLSDAAVAMTGPAGRKLSLSDTLAAAVAVALRHPDEYVAALNADTQGPTA